MPSFLYFFHSINKPIIWSKSYDHLKAITPPIMFGVCIWAIFEIGYRSFWLDGWGALVIIFYSAFTILSDRFWEILILGHSHFGGHIYQRYTYVILEHTHLIVGGFLRLSIHTRACSFYLSADFKEDLYWGITPFLMKNFMMSLLWGITKTALIRPDCFIWYRSISILFIVRDLGIMIYLEVFAL